MSKPLRIGNAHAFWGDRLSAARDLLRHEPSLDFLVMDFLAEVSMSILAGQRDRDPASGFVREMVDVAADLAAHWAAGGRCRVIVNAGGLDPTSCAEACRRKIEEVGCRSVRIGVVTGDDVLPLLAAAVDGEFANLDSGDPLSVVRDRLVTANAYLGAAPIVDALSAGADLVITGRIADPSPVVAACRHVFGWRADEWDRIAAATVAGHLIECGTQVTGGISTDWLDVQNPQAVGFPVAEITADGGCVITKPLDTGGRVTEETVKEQLFYEIGDPDNYLSPDVTVSFMDVQVTTEGRDRVRVAGARGRPPPRTLKVSATYRDGFRAAAMLTVFGSQAAAKARRCGEIILQRLAEAGWRYRDSLVECLGQGDSVPVLSTEERCPQAYESVMRVAVEDASSAAVEAFTREVMPMVTAGPQGVTGYAEGRPRVHRVFRFWPCAVPAELVEPRVHLLASVDVGRAAMAPLDSPSPRPETCASRSSPQAARAWPPRRLEDIAYGRSGDKGTAANIGILVRDAEDYPWLITWLTAERVARALAPLGIERVEAYPLPSLGGVNFVISGALRRGIRNDAQGKALAQALLAIPVDTPPNR